MKSNFCWSWIVTDRIQVKNGRVRTESWILEKVLKFAQHFPDLGKVWKIEEKSWKNGKKSCVFLKAVQEVLQKWFFFRVGQILFNLAGMSWKKLCSCVFFFKVSFDQLFDNLESGKIYYCFGKSLEKVLNFGSKICTNPERKGNSSPCVHVLRKRFTSSGS